MHHYHLHGSILFVLIAVRLVKGTNISHHLCQPQDAVVMVANRSREEELFNLRTDLLTHNDHIFTG